jgi:hypothetical protein
MRTPPNLSATPFRLACSIVFGLALAVLMTSRVLGHSIWIEPSDDGQLVVRFSEPGEEYETSPGHLDGVSPPVAFAFGTNGSPQTIDAPRKTDHFLLPNLSPTHAACLEAPYAVMTTPGRPGRKPIFYARWQPDIDTAADPALTLDLVPTGKPGEVRVYFRGQPLADITATLHGPDGKNREIVADAEGYLRFTADQSGLHHLSIGRHRETQGGFHGGLAYELTSHNAALTWIQR